MQRNLFITDQCPKTKWAMIKEVFMMPFNGPNFAKAILRNWTSKLVNYGNTPNLVDHVTTISVSLYLPLLCFLILANPECARRNNQHVYCLWALSHDEMFASHDLAPFVTRQSKVGRPTRPSSLAVDTCTFERDNSARTIHDIQLSCNRTKQPIYIRTIHASAYKMKIIVAPQNKFYMKETYQNSM